MRLMTVAPNGHVTESRVRPDTPNYEDWLHWIVEDHPEINFFYTVDSTDIWEEDQDVDRFYDFKIDFNTVLYSFEGQLRHTYDPECGSGCHGQLETCKYRRK